MQVIGSPSYTDATTATTTKTNITVGRCRLTPGVNSSPHACLQLLKLKYDNMLSNFAFNCNLRHYITGAQYLSGWFLLHSSKNDDNAAVGSIVVLYLSHVSSPRERETCQRV